MDPIKQNQLPKGWDVVNGTTLIETKNKGTGPCYTKTKEEKEEPLTNELFLITLGGG